MSADPFAPPATARLEVGRQRPSRLWPDESETAASPATVLSALAVGVLAALILGSVPGLAYLVVGTGVLAVALGARRRALPRPQALALVVTIVFLAVPAVRGAPWLAVLSLVGACLLGTLALVGGRTWTGLVIGALSSGLAPRRAARWVRRARPGFRIPGVHSGRAWIVGGATAVLAGLFGALFATADPAYAALLGRVVPAVELSSLGRRLPVLGAVTAIALVAAFLSHQPPRADTLAPPAGRPVRRWEWGVPLVVLDALFLSFVMVQLTVLFGGRSHVLATDGLTYAEYARQGFWQLLVVTVLTLAVIAAAARLAPRATRTDRFVVRVLLALLCLLALAIVASAIHRMSLYEEQFGFTRLRLFASAVELALGAMFVLLLAAGIQLRGSWLPRAAVGLAAVALLALTMANPDAYIAEHDVQRYERTGRIDLTYLSTLSPDAVPALDRLPVDLRSCALERLDPQLRGRKERWYDVNASRARARRLLEIRPIVPCRVDVDRLPRPSSAPEEFSE